MATHLNQPLFWHQGLFLQPHHFQYQDAWTERLLARQVELTMPWCWGFGALEINETALAAREVVIDHMALRWRDGTLTEIPGNARIESRRFELVDFSQGPRTLYVGLRRPIEDQVNVRKYDNLDDAAQADARLVVPADPQEVPDRYASGPSGRVTLMTYVLRLFWEEEINDLSDYDVMPVARLEQDGEIVRLVPRFVPPCLNVAASKPLQHMMMELRDEVIGRARQLEVFKQPIANRSGEDGQFAPMLALSVLNRYGPQITHLVETRQTHPWEIYGVLRQLAGELSTFSDFCDLLGETRDNQQLVRPYKHIDIGPAFMSVLDLIKRLLNEITIGPEMLVHFEQDGGTGNLYRADMPATFFGPRHRYYLMARSASTEPKALSEAIMLEAKLGTPDQIETLVTRSLPGIEVMPLQTLPLGMPRRTGSAYFRIESLSETWDAVTRDGRLSLYLPDSPGDLRLELIVIKG
jgi:type VI secretion system protein ImpJ